MVSRADIIDVVAAVMVGEGPGEVLAFRRAPGEREAGCWEFPGGKIEDSETPEAALAREIDEELGLAVVVGEPLWTGREGRIRVTFYRVDRASRPPALRVHDAVASVPVDAPPDLRWASVDRLFVHHLARLWGD
ncbi:MAG: NUDIX domain-containing protein [Myxococcota bacterium]|jgi:8-oxo-dGTP diphosphatase|nr:NUDIX domain-containing protein [Myxococcota bacterium]